MVLEEHGVGMQVVLATRGEEEGVGEVPAWGYGGGRGGRGRSRNRGRGRGYARSEPYPSSVVR